MRTLSKIAVIILLINLSACTFGVPVDPRMPTGEAGQGAPQSEATVAPTVAAEPPTEAAPAEPSATVAEPSATAAEPTAPPAEPSATPTTEATAEPTAVPPTATAVPAVTESAAAAPGDLSKLGGATAIDPMDKAQDWLWPTGKNDYTAIEFKDGSLLLTALKDKIGWRLANPTLKPFGNLYVQAVVTSGSCSGNDQYGIIARVPKIREADRGYLFGLTCDGQYSIRTWDGKVAPKGEMTRLVDWTKSDVIRAGSDQVNTIGVFTSGKTLALYVNGKKLAEVTDGTYAQGNFGLFVAGFQTKNFTIKVSEMAYWLDPKP